MMNGLFVLAVFGLATANAAVFKAGPVCYQCVHVEGDFTVADLSLDQYDFVASPSCKYDAVPEETLVRSCPDDYEGQKTSCGWSILNVADGDKKGVATVRGCIINADQHEGCSEENAMFVPKGQNGGETLEVLNVEGTQAVHSCACNGEKCNADESGQATPPTLPENPASSTTDPENPSPTTADPENSSPTTADPGNSSPTTADPENSSPTTADPGNSSPTTADPGNSSPTTADPGNSSPTTADPGNSSPTTADPGNSSPTTADPGNSSPTTKPPGQTSPTTPGSGENNSENSAALHAGTLLFVVSFGALSLVV